MRGWGSRLRGEWARLRGLGRRGERADRLDEEMRFHLDMLTARHERAGLTPRAARRAALVEFGGVARFEEAARDEYRSRPLEELGRDVRHAVRQLVRAPAFTTAAVLTLALGVGATTVVFTMVDHVVLRPLPYPAAERLVLVREVVQEVSDTYASLAAKASHYLEWRASCGVCEDVAALRPAGLTWTGAGEPERLDGIRISANFFGMLGVQPAHGRLFREEEDRAGASEVVVVSHAFWRGRLGGDPSAVGSTLMLNERPREIVGVLPPDFRLPKGDELGPRAAVPADPELFIPLVLSELELAGQGSFNYVAVARLQPGVSAAQAEAHLNELQSALGARSTQPVTLSARVVPLHEQVVGRSARALWLLLAAVAAVLLLVCVNLASLLLARNAGRARESAVRVALGAGRGRLVRESLTESVVLALAAGVVGLALSYWGLAALLQLAPAELPRLHEVRLDARVAGAAVLLSLLTGMLFGGLPALRTAAADPHDVLKAGGRTQSAGRRAVRGRAALIASQVGVTAVLLVAAGLFLVSFARVVGVDKGFEPERVLALDVVVPGSEYRSHEELQAVYARVLDRLRAVPGVTAAAAASRLPLDGVLWGDNIFEEHDARPQAERPVGNLHFVTPDYFRTLAIPVRRGGVFTEADRGRDVVVLSARAAALVWPGGENPVGRRVVLSGLTTEVVGVVADVTATGLEAEPSALAYLPPWTALGFPAATSIVLRTGVAPASLAVPARAALREASAGSAVARVRTLEQMVADAAAARRFQLSLLVLFALTALVTACVGIYGVIAHALANRRGEIGVRMALGAHRVDIHRLVLREGVGAAVAGLLVGLAVAVAIGRFFESLLFGVRAADPAVLAAVAALLVAVAAIASYVPARRASGGALGALRED